ncbi:MAG: hypothetical protein JNN20_09845 [Betaproteobacteria bacterium]|nr:hypothetical protein [Betaproteobacteria bacterium]
MNAGQYIYFGLGLFFIVIGAVSLVDSPRRRAKRAAEIDTRVVTDGEITKYRLESDARTRGIPDDGVTEYRAQIEYTVDGHRYQIKAARAVSKPGALNEKVRVAYQRAMPSDAIEVREDIADDRAFAKFSIGIGLLLLVAGWFDW